MPSEFWNRVMHDAEHGRLAEAVAAARLQVRMKPRDPESVEMLGLLLFRAGDVEQSIHFLRRGVELLPREPVHHHNLANVLLRAGQVPEAVKCWNAALALQPDMAMAWMGLASAHFAADDTTRAIEAGERALALAPEWMDLVRNHSNALARAGRVDQAVALLRGFLARHPGEADLRSNLLLDLQYRRHDAAQVLAEHRAFGAALPSPQPPPRAELAGRKFRVGILSSDLRAHSVGHFAEAILAHAPADTEVVVFSSAPVERAADPMTSRYRALAAGWHEVTALSDPALDAAIRAQRVDVLVELNGHSSGGRLPALARKPAPVLVSAIGYPDTTGLPAVDARVVDSVTDPAGAEARCTERLLRLDPCFLCYAPPPDAPEPRMPPGDAPVTFGSFNNALKISPETLEAWAGVLGAVPQARLLLKSPGLSDPAVQADLRGRMDAAGIDASRVELVAFAGDRLAHLQLYGRVHVALDTVPYNGTTTTCEALWMGVPVVTMLGDRHAARVSASLLRAAGLGEWVTDSPQAFAKVAASLALDRDALAARRADLRNQLRASPLLDAAAYGRRLHTALRDLYSSPR